MKIQRDNTDKNYPVLISDGWGGQVHLQIEDLETLKEEIGFIIEEIKAEEANKELLKVAKEGIKAIRQICQNSDCSICPIGKKCERLFDDCATPATWEWD